MKRHLRQTNTRLSSPELAEIDRRMGVPVGALTPVGRDRIGRLTISSLQPIRFAEADTPSNGEADAGAPAEGSLPEWLVAYASTLDESAAAKLLEEIAKDDPTTAAALEAHLSGSGRSMRSASARLSRPSSSSGDVRIHRDSSGRLIVT